MNQGNVILHELRSGTYGSTDNCALAIRPPLKSLDKRNQPNMSSLIIQPPKKKRSRTCGSCGALGHNRPTCPNK